METDCINTGDPGRATRTLARAHTNTHTPRRDLHTADFCLTSRPRTPHLRGETEGSCGLEENPPLPHPPKHTHSDPALYPKGAGNHLREAQTAPLQTTTFPVA